MKLSIITVNFNNQNGLNKTLESIKSQTCKDFEWIVIDGGSSDGSRELLEHNSSIIDYWISETDKGIYHAMNKGIAKANGEYLQFLNSGDVLTDEKVVSDIIPYLKGSDIYLSNMYHESSIGRPVVNPKSLEPSRILHTIAFGAIMHPTSYIRQDCFNKYGYYNEDMRIISDWLFFFNAIVLNKASFSYIPVVSVIFDETGISTINPDLSEKEKEEYFKQYYYIGQLYSFYKENYEIVDSLESNKFVFFLYRIYFFIHRKLHFKR